jgi:hypothetical protein
MRGLLLGTIAALTLGAAGAVAQTPVPNASGSQVTAPSTYRATASQNRARQPMMKRQASVKKQNVAKRRYVTTTGSVRRALPVPNASGSQVTNPETYRARAYQNRR